MINFSHIDKMKNRIKNAAGFSLVEVMVAMVIGLLGIVIMLQVYSNFESQKRTTAGGDDALNAGAIALYGMQRDIQQSGWGIASGVFGCNLIIPASGVVPARTVPIAPVAINPAATVIPVGDANTDRLLVMYGYGNGGQEGNRVGTVPPGPINIYNVNSPYEFSVNERVIAVPNPLPAPCNLSLDTVTLVDGPNANVSVTTGVAAMSSGTVFNLGRTQKIAAYAIRNGKLTVCDYMSYDCGNAGSVGNAAIWVPLATNIVSMKAQYGRDTLSAAVSAYAPPYPSYKIDIWDRTTPTTLCGWMRIPAIRLALVARNSQAMEAGVTPNAPAWEGSYTIAASAPFPANTANPISLASGWQNYRYKLFQTIAPIRNISTKWMQPGC